MSTSNTSPPGGASVQHRHLYLPDDGPAFTCPTADALPDSTAFGHDRCSAAHQDLAEFEIPPHTQPGALSFNVLIYLGVAVVHIQRVDLDVAQGPGAAARVTYRLLHSFDRLPDLTDRTASVTEDAEHLIINGIGAPGVRSAGRNSAFGFRASDGQGNGAVVQAREELIARHFTTRKGGWAPLYPDVDVPTNEYRDSLLHVAVLGRTLFNQLFNTPASRELAPMLQHEARARGRPPVVQIARTVRHPFVIPWQILYELPLEHPEAGTAMCPSVDEYGPDGNGAWPPPAACPHLGEHERALAEQPGRAFLCPFGFWGLAHILEVPEPPPGQRSLDHVITSSRRPRSIRPS